MGGQLGTAGQGFSYGKGSSGGEAMGSGSAGQYGSDQQHHQGPGSGSGGIGGPGAQTGRGGAAGTAGVGDTGTGKYPLPRVMCLVPRAVIFLGMRPRLGVGSRGGLRHLSGLSGSRRIKRCVNFIQKPYFSVTFLAFQFKSQI